MRRAPPSALVAVSACGAAAPARPSPHGRARTRRWLARGITVVELMNVLGLASLVSALGMYGLSRYLRHAKTLEAVGSVTALATGAADFYNASDATQPAGSDRRAVQAMRHFPPGSRGTVPGDALDVRGKRYQSSAAEWATSPWRDLKFSLSTPQHYAYGFSSEGSGEAATATAQAKGDLDADGQLSTFELKIVPDATLVARVAREMIVEERYE